jgi:tryptophan synthase alpha chain
VTGRRTDLDRELNSFIEECRGATELPLGLGFGLRNGDDLRRLQGAVEMAIVGSALLEEWEEKGREGYRRFLEELAEGRN